MEQLEYEEDQDQTYLGSKVMNGNHDACSFPKVSH